MIRSKEKLKELSGYRTDVFKRNMIDRYIDRPVCGEFACLRNKGTPKHSEWPDDY